MAAYGSIYPRIATDEASALTFSQAPISTATTPASTGCIAITGVVDGVEGTYYIPVYAVKRS
jgi:hypothetical protein